MFESIKKIFSSAAPQVEIQSAMIGTETVYGSNGSVIYGSSLGFSFNGEKTLGELGEPTEVFPEYYGLRLRAYEANLTNDTIKIITNKYFKWTIGNGLKVQSEPLEDFLNIKGFKPNLIDIKNHMESVFELYSSLNNSDYSQMKNFHQLGLDAYVDSFLGGDCVVIYRFENGYPTVQVVDGQNVESPLLSDVLYTEATERGHFIKHGVEVDKKGRHIAYFVRSEKELGLYHYERVPAFVEVDGVEFVHAKMIYFGKHRTNHVRGVSALSAILEKVNKLDRYTEATVASAEERAKIPYFIQHDIESTGENPLLEKTKLNLGLLNPDSGQAGQAINGAELQKQIARSTNKTVINMPNGSKIQAIESRNEITYQPLFEAIFTQVAAALDMPPEVALQKFDSNYSASRAAMKVWEYMVKIDRTRFAKEFYQPFYDLLFYREVLLGGLNAPGYLKALDSKDFMTVGAYTKARFEGVNMPHIDPLKEVNAIRTMLGTKFDDVPLTSLAKGTKELNQGDWWINYSEIEQEVKENKLNLNENQTN